MAAPRKQPRNRGVFNRPKKSEVVRLSNSAQHRSLKPRAELIICKFMKSRLPSFNLTLAFGDGLVRSLLFAIILALQFTPGRSFAGAGDVYPEFAQFYTQQKKAAAEQANKLDNAIAQYNLPVEQALDRTSMDQMYRQMGGKNTVALPDFNPIGQLPIQNLNGLMKSLGQSFFGIAEGPRSSAPMLASSIAGLSSSKPASQGLLATSIQGGTGEKKVISKPDHANYESQNKSGATASDGFPQSQKVRPCSSATFDKPC